MPILTHLVIESAISSTDSAANPISLLMKENSKLDVRVMVLCVYIRERHTYCLLCEFMSIVVNIVSFCGICITTYLWASYAC